MATYTDLTIYGKAGEKKRISVFSTPTLEFLAGDVIDNALLFVLPPNSMIDEAYVITEAGATVETLDIKVGSTVVVDNATIGALGTDEVSTTKPYFEAGGNVTVVASASLTTDVSFRIVLTYLELETGSGFRTR